MAKTPEELEKMFTDLQDQQAKSEKEFNQKLEMAQRDTKQYKELAEKNAEALRNFQQDSEKRDKEQKEAIAKARLTEDSEFVESQIKAGRIIPAMKEKVITFMKSLTSETAVMEFKEKDGSTRSHTQISLFKEMLLKMKPVMPVGSEFSVADVAEIEEIDGTQKPVEVFTEVFDKGERKKLPVEGADLAAKAFEYQAHMQKLGKVIEYADALIAVEKLGKKSVVKA